MKHPKHIKPTYTPAPLPVFSYEPASALIRWQDKNGPKSGNLASFHLLADVATVILINLSGQGVTKITIGPGFPMLLRWDDSHNLLTEHESLAASPSVRDVIYRNNPSRTLPSFYNNRQIKHLDYGDNLVEASPDLSMLEILESLQQENNRHPTVNWAANPKVININAYGLLAVTTASITTNRELRTLDLGGNTAMTRAAIDQIIITAATFGHRVDLLLFQTKAPSQTTEVQNAITLLRSYGSELQLDE